MDRVVVNLRYSPKTSTLQRKFGNLPIRYIRASVENEQELRIFENACQRWKFSLKEDIEELTAASTSYPSIDNNKSSSSSKALVAKRPRQQIVISDDDDDIQQPNLPTAATTLPPPPPATSSSPKPPSDDLSTKDTIKTLDFDYEMESQIW